MPTYRLIEKSAGSFRPWKKTQMCCSRSCARKHSPVFQAHLRSVARKGARAAARAKHAQSNAFWRERAQGMTPEQIAKVNYRRGYNAGLAKAGRAAFARGYQQSIEDTIAAVLT